MHCQSIGQTTAAQTRKRKRQPDPPAQIAEPPAEKRPRLTREALEEFASQGGPDVSELRGFARHNEMPSKHGSSGRKSTAENDSQKTEQSDKRLTAYNSSFEGHLAEHGLLSARYPHDDWHAAQPINLEEWEQALLEERASLSPKQFTQEHFRGYKNAVFQASNEKEIMGNPFSTVAGRTNARRAMDRSFDHMDPMTDGGIIPPKPDAFAGAAPSTIDKKVRTELAHLLVPSFDPTDPVAPNFYVEAKGRRGNNDVALHQACLDGAVGARAIQSLQSFEQELLVFDNQAYSITVTFDGQLLRIFCSHPVRPTSSDDLTLYHMHQLGAYAMTHNRDTFVAGASAFRNAFRLAEIYRTKFIEQANEKAREVPPQHPSAPRRTHGSASAKPASAKPRNRSRAKKSATSTRSNSQVNTSFEETSTQDISTTTITQTSESRVTRSKTRGSESKANGSNEPPIPEKIRR